jgi:hypothetical protein
VNAPVQLSACIGQPPLAARLFALLAPAAADSDSAPEARWLAAHAAALGVADVSLALAQWQADPPAEDSRLQRLAESMALEPAELFALALAYAADTDLIAGRALAWLQAPLREAHPTLGLVACLEEQRGRSASSTLATIVDGAALAGGALVLDAHDGPLTDARLRVPLPLVAALAGGSGQWPGVRLGAEALPQLAASAQAEAARRAAALGAALVVRSGHVLEARAACAAIAHARGQRAAFIEGEIPAGLAPWLRVHDALPVICAELAPGERRRVPRIPGLAGTLLFACGIDGAWEREGTSVPSWSVPVPGAAERAALWSAHGLAPALAQTLGRTHRHAAARIGDLAHAGERERAASGDPVLGIAHVARAARAAGQGALGTLAELLSEDIPDDALILPAAMRRELAALGARCRTRESLADGLGAAARARYRSAVRALFTGVSGTGKTLACGWLATQLGLPLYRVDLASISSKYIGETEKNLGELFGRAEHAEVILLFDEADALFARRTEVKDANDRYANQQSNYLLQRIESYDGIVLLTSNSRARFDPAYTRRLDVILEFPTPGPEERRELWRAHLGDAHEIGASDLNRLAVSCDLCGGHIRNATFAARAIAGCGPISWSALVQAVAFEYRKLGKHLPVAIDPGAAG